MFLMILLIIEKHKMKKIGRITQQVIDLLGLSITADTPIFIGQKNTEHMKSRHPYEFEVYYPQIEDILSNPDYVGYNTHNGSIDYVKLFRVNSNYIQISVRISGSGQYFARTLFQLSTYKAERYIEQGALKSL